MYIDGTFKTKFWKCTNYCMLVVAIEKGMDYKKLQKVDVLDFLKQTRKFFVKDENL